MSRPPILEGLIVAERGGRLAAAVATTLLGSLGATVVRLEGARGRPASDPPAWHEHPVALGLKTRIGPAGDDHAAWQALSRRAHVAFVSAPATGGSASAASLTVSLTAYGADAPDFAASELALQARSGAMATTGRSDGPPCAVRAPLLEMLAGVNAATSVLAALRAGTQDATLDLAVFDSALALAGTLFPQALADPARIFRDGAQHPLCVPWNAYRAADGWVTLCVASDDQWRRCARLIGRPDLAADPALATGAQRVAARSRIDAAVSDWAGRRSVADAVRETHAEGLPASAVRQPGPATAPPLWMSETPLAAPGSTTAPTSDAVAESAPDGRPALARTHTADGSPPDGWPASVMGQPPLRGLRIIEIGPYTAGPLTGRYLADLGAEVIKVEAPGGENSRGWQPRVGHASAYFANYNCGKRSVTLELGTVEGAARMRQLVAGADVLLQNLKPGALQRLGLDPEELARDNPRLIVCSISGYGRDAPPLAALDTVVQAGSGLMSLVAGFAEGSPVKTGFSYGDLTAAHVATLGIMAAVLERDRSGRGQAIDVAMHDALAWLVQLGQPGIPAPSFQVRTDGNDGDSWLLDEGQGPPVTIRNIGAAVTSDEARARAILRRVGTGSSAEGAWTVLAAPQRWRALPPDIGSDVPRAGADNATLFDRELQPEGAG